MAANPFTAHLTNEFGRDITVSVARDADVSGVKHLNLTLVGPSSISENIITLAEARTLASLLNQTLENIPA